MEPEDGGNCLAYKRTDGTRAVLVVLNASDKAEKYSLPSEFAGRTGTDLLNGKSSSGTSLALDAYGFSIIEY
ncbi:alpha-glucosidase C-terminal domain-containing protein [Peribacillus deserti]